MGRVLEPCVRPGQMWEPSPHELGPWGVHAGFPSSRHSGLGGKEPLPRASPAAGGVFSLPPGLTGTQPLPCLGSMGCPWPLSSRPGPSTLREARLVFLLGEGLLELPHGKPQPWPLCGRAAAQGLWVTLGDSGGREAACGPHLWVGSPAASGGLGAQRMFCLDLCGQGLWSALGPPASAPPSVCSVWARSRGVGRVALAVGPIRLWLRFRSLTGWVQQLRRSRAGPLLEPRMSGCGAEGEGTAVAGVGGGPWRRGERAVPCVPICPSSGWSWGRSPGPAARASLPAQAQRV